MKVIRHLKEFTGIDVPVILAVGSFDGVHLGHQEVIDYTVRQAKQCHGQAWLLTFHPHPARILRPDRAPRLLMSLDQRLDHIAARGMDGCWVIPFTRETAETSSEDFLQELCTTIPHLSEFVMGPNWTFGHEARGTPEVLRRHAPTHGFTVTVRKPTEWQGDLISSSRIREAVLEGRIADAEAMLGHPYSVRGTVVTGRRRGRELGFPTANVEPDNEAWPPPGSYAIYSLIDGVCWRGAGYISTGYRNKKTPGRPIVEAHFFDVEDDLYGRELEIHFVGSIRPDERFTDSDDLRNQIRQDLARARELLAEYPHLPAP